MVQFISQFRIKLACLQVCFFFVFNVQHFMTDSEILNKALKVLEVKNMHFFFPIKFDVNKILRSLIISIFCHFKLLLHHILLHQSTSGAFLNESIFTKDTDSIESNIIINRLESFTKQLKIRG